MERIKELGNSDGDKETDFIKGASKFFRKLAKLTPKLCYHNIQLLFQLFDKPQYYYRQAILKILGNIVTEFLQKQLVNEDSDDDSDDSSIDDIKMQEETKKSDIIKI